MKTKAAKAPAKKAKPAKANPLRACSPQESGRDRKKLVHVYGHGAICDTDKLGRATPNGRSPVQIVVDASEGFIPLWAKDMTLRWRFRQRSLTYFQDSEAAKDAIRNLMGEALIAWDDAVPIKFTEREDAYDFEIVVRRADDCDVNGCVLASAFFPDPGRNQLVLYPQMFEQSHQEQVETLMHELGHVFGLRHFFAEISEAAWPSRIFGTHNPFSIMNYGSQSVLTEDDKDDLKRLYRSAWSGELTNIAGSPIRLVKPYNTIGAITDGFVMTGESLAACQARAISPFAARRP